MKKVSIIEGVLSDTGERLPRERGKEGCRKTGEPICSSTNLCAPCAEALAALWATAKDAPQETEAEARTAAARYNQQHNR